MARDLSRTRSETAIEFRASQPAVRRDSTTGSEASALATAFLDPPAQVRSQTTQHPAMHPAHHSNVQARQCKLWELLTDDLETHG